MPLFTALAVLGIARFQETIALRLSPPLDAPMEFSIALDASGLDGTSFLNLRMVIAQRAKREGANFRFSRYVAAASVDTESTNPKILKLRKEIGLLVGKSFPLLVDASGKSVPMKRGKYDNAADDLPNLVIPVLGAATTGQARTVGSFALGPSGTATLRDVRAVGSGRAAIFDFTTDPKSGRGTGVFAVSADDGLPLLMDVTAEVPPSDGLLAARIHLRVRRQNAPGLDRLAGDLRLDP